MRPHHHHTWQSTLSCGAAAVFVKKGRNNRDRHRSDPCILWRAHQSDFNKKISTSAFELIVFPLLLGLFERMHLAHLPAFTPYYHFHDERKAGKLWMPL